MMGMREREREKDREIERGNMGIDSRGEKLVHKERKRR